MPDDSIIDPRRGIAFGLKTVFGFEDLSLAIVNYYEEHPDEIQAAITRGFTIPLKEFRPNIYLHYNALGPNISEPAVSMMGVSERCPFAAFARLLPNIEGMTDIVSLGNSLIVHGYVFTSDMIDQIIEVAGQKEHYLLAHGNYLFLATNDLKNPVSVVSLNLFRPSHAGDDHFEVHILEERLSPHFGNGTHCLHRDAIFLIPKPPED